MEEERVREEIDGKLANGAYGWRKEHPLIRRETIDQILAIKLGGRTLRGWIKLYEQGKLEIRAEDQGLPENPYVALDSDGRIYGYDPDKANAYGGAQEDMKQAGFIKVLPRKE